MVQSFAEDLLHAILKELPEQDYTREVLKAAPLPSGITHFLENTLDRRLEFEMNRLTSGWFDFSNPAVQESIQYLRQQLFATARIPADEWHKTIEHATRLISAYLLRPCHTLAGFIFGRDTAMLDMETILRRMAYFSDYAYLSEIFETYARHNAITEMESGRFLDLITQIDRRYLKDFKGVQDWMDLLQPIFSIGAEIYKKGYPIYLFQIFFDDKGEYEFKKRLLFEEQIRGIQKLSPKELEDILRNVLMDNQGDVELSNSPFVSHSEFANEIPITTSAPVPPPPPDAVIVQNQMPRWKAFRPNQTPAHREVAMAGNTALALYPLQTPKSNLSLFQSKIQNLNDNLGAKIKKTTPTWQASTPATTAPQSAPSNEEAIADKYQRLLFETHELENAIFGGMHPERRTWYLQKLFDNRLVSYHLFLSRLRAIQSWGKAAELIAMEVFMKHDVNIYSEAALSFTELVESLYQHKS